MGTGTESKARDLRRDQGAHLCGEVHGEKVLTTNLTVSYSFPNAPEQS